MVGPGCRYHSTILSSGESEQKISQLSRYHHHAFIREHITSFPPTTTTIITITDR